MIEDKVRSHRMDGDVIGFPSGIDPSLKHIEKLLY